MATTTSICSSGTIPSPTSAPPLRSIGLVTGAIWSDNNQDGDANLLVTLEWGKVRFLRNTGHRLVDATSEPGLHHRTGWWNSITVTDLDRDGDMDDLVTNVGLNSKYGKASATKQATLFYGDMDRTGRPSGCSVQMPAPDTELPRRIELPYPR